MLHSLWVWISAKDKRCVAEGLICTIRGHDGIQLAAARTAYCSIHLNDSCGWGRQRTLRKGLRTLSGDLLGVTNRSPLPGRRNNWARCGRLPTPVKLRKEKRVYQSDFTALLPAHQSPSQFLHFAHVRLCRSANWMHPIFHLLTWPWLPVPDNFSKQDTSVEVRPCGMLCHQSRFMIVNLLCPIHKDVFW